MCLIKGHVGGMLCFNVRDPLGVMVCIIEGTRWEYCVLN